MRDIVIKINFFKSTGSLAFHSQKIKQRPAIIVSICSGTESPEIHDKTHTHRIIYHQSYHRVVRILLYCTSGLPVISAGRFVTVLTRAPLGARLEGENLNFAAS